MTAVPKDVKSQPPKAGTSMPGRRRPGRPRHQSPSTEYIARRNEIIAAAAQVFHQKGYDAGTLEDVAEALDIRRATLYHYVRSKHELLFLVIDRALGLAVERLAQYAKLPDPADRLEAFIRHQVRAVTSEPSMYTVYFEHRLKLDAKYRKQIREKERRYLKEISRIVEDSVRAGVIGKVDTRYGAQAIIGMTTWAYKWFDPKRDSVDRFADSCVELILAGFNRSREKAPDLGGNQVC